MCPTFSLLSPIACTTDFDKIKVNNASKSEEALQNPS